MRKSKKRLLALLLCVCVGIGVCPVIAAPAAAAGTLTVASGSPLRIDTANLYITGVSNSVSVATMLTNFAEATNTLSMKNASGTAISGNATAGTGSTLSVAGGSTYTVIVTGDVNGDSLINTSDYIVMKQVAKGRTTLSGAYKKAADADGSGTVGASDYIRVKSFVGGKGNLLFSAATPTLDKVEPVRKTLNYHSKTFKMSELTGTKTNTSVWNEKLVLLSTATSGTFVTDTINIGRFSNMLLSWNAITNGGKVEVSVSFEVTTGAWSGYLSFGVWSATSGVSSSVSSSNTYGTMGIDTLTVNSGYTTTGNIKVKIALTKYNGGAPVVQNITIATSSMAKANTVATSSLPSSYLNNVPMRSQVAPENGSIGGIICSPTTTAMGIQHMGTTVTSLTAAKAIYDNGAGIYGNWLFAAAYAGEKGYVAYCDFYDEAMIKYALSQGCVIGCSTKLTSSGHLVLVVGYKNGYYIVNDPNISASNPVRTEYTTSYFNSVWLKSNFNNLGVVYVFQKVYDLS